MKNLKPHWNFFLLCYRCFRGNFRKYYHEKVGNHQLFCQNAREWEKLDLKKNVRYWLKIKKLNILYDRNIKSKLMMFEISILWWISDFFKPLDQLVQPGLLFFNHFKFLTFPPWKSVGLFLISYTFSYEVFPRLPRLFTR